MSVSFMLTSPTLPLRVLMAVERPDWHLGMEPFPVFLIEKMSFEDASTPLWEQYS